MRAILTYHSIDPSGSPVSCDPECFARHVQWFQSGGVRVTTIDQLVTLPDSADAVAITFDDCFVNFGEMAAPRLLAEGLPVTVFVVSDRTGTTNAWGGVAVPGIPTLPLLDWDAIGRLAERGVQIGSHSRTHPDLTRLSADALADEVIGSAEIIQGKVGIRPAVFAYPYGRVDGRTADAVGGTYRFACTTDFRALHGAPPAARLPRLDAYYFQEAQSLHGWGTPEFVRAIRRRHTLRRVRRLPGDMMRQVLSLGRQ